MNIFTRRKLKGLDFYCKKWIYWPILGNNRTHFRWKPNEAKKEEWVDLCASVTWFFLRVLFYSSWDGHTFGLIKLLNILWKKKRIYTKWQQESRRQFYLCSLIILINLLTYLYVLLLVFLLWYLYDFLLFSSTNNFHLVVLSANAVELFHNRMYFYLTSC